jgi:hypothetical protein
VQPDKLDHRVLLETLDPQEHLEVRDTPEQRDQLVAEETRVWQDLRE